MPAEVAPLESLDQYYVYMDEVAALCDVDPVNESPEAVRLLALVDAIEDYEKQHWPDMFPPRDDE